MSERTVDRGRRRFDGATLHGYLRLVVYTLAALLAFALLAVGTVAIIAELKGTWHWAIHLESTVSYVGLFIYYLLYALVPLFGLLLVSRWWVDA
ncbi:hypothetical protein G9464_15250 [Halostella sp. JP-L12]|uniref:hypothetical protein n=1 Tax=Halostella TaxID=1843185 RepID=UPI000EF82A98|nr:MULTISPECIES: hypothetical protein [Halostella]NHN48941.1 hypothetical protein [Halostella sp. JP-L12]